MNNTKLYALLILGLLIAGLIIASYYSVTRGIRGLRAKFHLTKWLLYAIVAIFAFGLFQGIGVGGAGFFGRDTSLHEEGIIARVAGQPIRQADVERLLESLNRLVDAGHTVLLIEHHLDVIKTADHVIDLGPEGGHAGGEVVVTGTPEDVAGCGASYTGRFLKPRLEG